MKTHKTFNLNTRKILISLLVACTLLFSALGISSLSSLKNASAATYDFAMVSNSMEQKYYQHWSNGQGQRVAGQSSGKWYFGYGDVSENGNKYSFTQCNFDGSQNSCPYTPPNGSSHTMYWRFNVSTRLYSSANTQTMFVWEAEARGDVSFSGIFSKATSDKQELGGTQNGYDKLWLAGINWSNTDFNWIDGQSYTCSMSKVSVDGTVDVLYEKTYTSEYVWLPPQTEYSVEAGDRVVFGLKCNDCAKGQEATLKQNDGTEKKVVLDEWYTNTLATFTSVFNEDKSDAGVVDPPVVDPDEPTLPDTLEDITAPTTGFKEIAHYKFDDSAKLGKDSLGNYDLENQDLEMGANGVTLNGNSSTPKFMYATKLAKDGSDFSDAVKGSFSLSFKIFAKQGKEGDGDHVIFSTGDGTDGFEVLWSTTDLVVKAGGQEYRIDNAYVKNDLGEDEQIFMLDSKASWYRYTIVYDETNAEDIQLRIRVDRFNDDGTMYGNMTVKTIKRLKSKVVFGGNLDYSFTIGANSTFGTYSQNYARGYDSSNQDFSPILSDLRIYSGVVTEDEIKSVWSDDEGDNYYDRSASWKLTIENSDEGGSIEGAQSIEYGDRTALNITVKPNTGYKIKSIKWNAGSGDVDVPISKGGTATTFEKTMTSDCTLKVEYEQIMYQVTVYANNVKDKTVSGKYAAMSKLSVEIQPDDGNEISLVTLNGLEIKKANYNAYNKNGFTYTFDVTGECELKITYVQKTFSVMFNIDGTTDKELTKKVNANDEITVNIEAPSGKKIASISYGGKSVKIDDTNDKSVEFTFKVTATTTVKVVFEEDASGCLSSVMPIYGASALILLAGAFLVVKKARKSK